MPGFGLEHRDGSSDLVAFEGQFAFLQATSLWHSRQDRRRGATTRGDVLADAA